MGFSVFRGRLSSGPVKVKARPVVYNKFVYNLVYKIIIVLYFYYKIVIVYIIKFLYMLITNK